MFCHKIVWLSNNPLTQFLVSKKSRSLTFKILFWIPWIVRKLLIPQLKAWKLEWLFFWNISLLCYTGKDRVKVAVLELLVRKCRNIWVAFPNNILKNYLLKVYCWKADIKTICPKWAGKWLRYQYINILVLVILGLALELQLFIS